MLAVKQYIEDTPVISTDFISFNINNIEEYKKLFNKYKEKGVIHKDALFDSLSWLVSDSVIYSNIKFDFSEILFEKMKRVTNTELTFHDFIVSMKAFVLYNLSENDFKTVKANISMIKNLFLNTTFLSEDCIDENFWEDYSTKWRVAYPLSLYLSFCEDFQYSEELIEEINDYYKLMSSNLKEKESENKYRRLLPLYNTMFKFNDIMDDFIQFATGDERELYFPLILWWKITTIIPIRSTEFSVTPLNCIGKDKKGRPVIKLYRTRAKGIRKGKLDLHSFKEKYKLCEHPVTDDIIKLIEEYKSLVEVYDKDDDFYGDNSVGAIKRKYLLSARSYFKYNRNQDSNKIYNNNPDVFTTNQFNKLIKRFMKDIVFNKYNIAVTPKERFYGDPERNFDNSMQMINMMDTRHFAIMNLVHLGYSPSTIQRIVGHDNISTSFAYSDHQEVFTDCYVVSIAKKKAFKKNSEFKNKILDMSFENLFGIEQGSGNRRYNMVKSKNNSSEATLKLDDGYCTYNKKDMLPCKILRGNHRRCPFFVPFKDNLDIIGDELDIISNEISSEIKTLQYMVNHHKVIKDFENKYQASLNKLKAIELQKGEMIADYIINGVNKEDEICDQDCIQTKS